MERAATPATGGGLEAIVFDVDGTLVDSERDGHRVAFNRAFEEAGRSEIERSSSAVQAKSPPGCASSDAERQRAALRLTDPNPVIRQF